MTQTPARLETTCAIVGGGPAGMMLGYLLARAGVDVVVLEKHADFFRDFRGDTIHPSTLEVIHELGLLEEFLQRPHQEVTELHGVLEDDEIIMADFTRLKTYCKFLAFMPQWEFLDFLAEHARAFSTFKLRMNAAATELIEEEGRVVGVRASTPEGPLEVRAALTVGADGRQSTVRALSGLTVRDLGAPIDVLWMQISRLPSDPNVPLGRFHRGRIFVMIYRGEYWQCGFVIPKDGYQVLRDRGLPALQEDIATVAPFLKDRVAELTDWSQIKLLTIKVDRLDVWSRPGLLCIGDAAHAMSPVGGVGINLAIQDAVATANLLVNPLRAGTLSNGDLARVQRRRVFPTKVTQWLQVQIQNRVIRRALGDPAKIATPLALRLLRRWPILRRIPARLVGVGVRPEHVSASILRSK